MSIETICLLIFVLGISIIQFIPERVIAVIAGIAGIVWSIIVIVKAIR